jgi:uncharacterized protein (TIGR02996 family)
MDLLLQHEAFLRAIFDAPDDDTPRLVYADFLQENGAEDRAELIRLQCELVRNEIEAERASVLRVRETVLIERIVPWHEPEDWTAQLPWRVERGFWSEPVRGRLALSAGNLSVPQALRWTAVGMYPQWFGERTLGIRHDEPLKAEHVGAVFELPFVQQVTHWDLSGYVEELPLAAGTRNPGVLPLVEMNVYPAITTPGVEALTQQRGARRIVTLDLRNNNLDNDAARALVKSPYLDNLKRLQLLEGNRFRGKVWQQVIERFGENVVG